MSVSLTKADGVTVLTLTADPHSPCPPLCQILKGLCYSPVCCSVSQPLKRIQGTSQSVLGAVQIMAGLLTIGFGAILYASYSTPWYYLDYTMYHFWLGGLFIFFGAMCIVSEKWPSPCMVIINVIVNTAGLAFAITAIVLYILNISLMGWWGGCDPYYDRGFPGYDSPRQSSREDLIREKCLESNTMTMVLLRGINALLIALSLMQFCAAMSSAILGIKALRSSRKTEDKGPDDPDCEKLLVDITDDPVV